MDDYKKEEMNINRIGRLLFDLGVVHVYIDMHKEGLHPAIAIPYPHPTKEFCVVIRSISVKNFDWIKIYCHLLNISDLSIKTQNELFKYLMYGNFCLAETKFGLEGDCVYLTTEMPIDISPKDFKYEFDGLSSGIDIFIPIVEKLGLRLDTTKSDFEEMRDEADSYDKV